MADVWRAVGLERPGKAGGGAGAVRAAKNGSLKPPLPNEIASRDSTVPSTKARSTWSVTAPAPRRAAKTLRGNDATWRFTLMPKPLGFTSNTCSVVAVRA